MVFMNKNFNIPNALSILRLFGVPVFVYFALISRQDALAIIVLMFAGATDYLDGKLARRWNQTSTLGAVLDPAADRVYITATLIILFIRHAISPWVLVVLLTRDLILFILTLILKARGHKHLEVTYLGKAATFNLLYAFPLLLLATHDSLSGRMAFATGWGFAIWGIVLYSYTGVMYFLSGVKSIRVRPLGVKG